MTTKLNSFGILIDEASFLKEIEGYDPAQKLADGWSALCWLGALLF